MGLVYIYMRLGLDLALVDVGTYTMTMDPMGKEKPSFCSLCCRIQGKQMFIDTMGQSCFQMNGVFATQDSALQKIS